MAYVRTIVDKIPLANGYTPIYPLVKEDYWFSASIHTNDSWTGDPSTRPLVLYFHGSGSAGHVPVTDPIAKAVVDKGAIFIAIRNFSSGTSSGSPRANAYGNVHSPIYYSLQIKNAWWVQAAIDYVRSAGLSNRIILLGHSNGTSAAFAWSMLSGTAGFSSSGEVSCIVGNGMTQGGLDNQKWNLVMRNISVVTQVTQYCKHPAILFYADRDGFCPPDFARRVQADLPPGSPVNIISPGNYTHNWFAQRLDFWSGLMMDLYNGAPLMVNGKQVIPGNGA